MKKLRIGIIGCGTIAVAHLNGYAACGDAAEVAGFADTDIEKAREKAEQWGGRAFSDYREMIRELPLDAVNICVPIKAHAEVCLECINRGLHILVEKPFTLNFREAKQVVGESRRRGITLMVAHNLRYHPRYLKARELLAGMGDVVCARADINQYLPDIWPAGHWHYKHRGVLLSTGIHMLDLLRFLVGDVKRAAAFNKITIDGMEGGDAAVSMLEFDSGAIGTMVALWSSKGAPQHDSIIIQASKGSVHTINGLHFSGETGSIEKIELNEKSHGDYRLREDYVNEAKHFIECVIERKEPVSGGEDNLKTMAAVEAMFMSSAENRIVDVDEITGGQS